jgi:hypothetical protein
MIEELGQLRARAAALETAIRERSPHPDVVPGSIAAPPPMQSGILSKLNFSEAIQTGAILIRSSDQDNDPLCNVANAFTVDLSAFCTEDEPNQWLSVKFNKFVIAVTGYVLRSINAAPESVHPRGWVFEGSMDGVDWKEFDSQRDTVELNRPAYAVSFALQGLGPQYWPMCRGCPVSFA